MAGTAAGTLGTGAAPPVLVTVGSPSPGGTEATERQAERAFAAMARPGQRQCMVTSM